MKFRMQIFPDMKTLFRIIILGLVGLHTGCVRAEDVGHIRMKDINGFRLTLLSSHEVDKTNICVAGYAFDPEDAKSIAVGLVMNPRTLDVSWAKAVRPAEDFHQNRFTGCFAAAGKIFFLEESDTQASPELSQAMIHLTSASGSPPDLVKRHKVWEDGKRNWLVGLFSDSARVTIVLGHDPKTGTPDVEMSAHPFVRETLAPEPAIRVKHGTFLSGSKVIFDGKTLVIAGQFTKSGSAIEAAMNKAAISRSGNYIWAKPLPSDVVIGGPDRKGHLFQVVTDRERGKASIVDVTSAAIPVIKLALPDRECVPQWLLPDTALISKACHKDMLTIQSLTEDIRSEVKHALPKAVPGNNTVLFYSPSESGADGYRFGAIAP
jgi:hypothetical protein